MKPKQIKPKVWRVVITQTSLATRDIYANSKAEAEEYVNDLLADGAIDPNIEDCEPEVEIKKVYHRPDIAPCECDVSLVENDK